MNDRMFHLLLEELTLMRKAAERIADRLDEKADQEREPLDDVDELNSPEDVGSLQERLNRNAKKHREQTKGSKVQEG